MFIEKLYINQHNKAKSKKMKAQLRFLLLLAITVLPLGFLSAKKTTTLQIDFKFENIEEGYDHLCKTNVYVDGELLATSSEKLQSKPNSVTVSIPKGEHNIRVVNLALYEGSWEEHTKDNNYSIDCMHEFKHDFKKKKYNLRLVFDLNSDTKVTFK